MKINKLLQPPVLPCDPNDFYFVKNGNFVDCYLSNLSGDTLYRVFDCKNFPSIEGPNAVISGSPTSFTITDFDFQTEYIITAVNGTATRVNDVITFTSDLVSSSFSFTVNGLVVPLEISTVNTAPTFDAMIGGRVPRVTINQVNTYVDEAYSNKIVQADGKIIVSTIPNDASYNEYYVISRINVNGSIDTTYGTNGHTVVESNVNNTNSDDCLFFDISENLFVLKCGYTGKYVLSKYNTSGILDTTFGTNGISDIELPIAYATDGAYINNQYNQADGKILVCGNIYVNSTGFNAGVIFRLNQNGTIDTTFGTNGFIITELANTDISYRGLCQDTNNNIFALQYYYEITDMHFLLKYSALGVLDTGFGISGGIDINILSGFYYFVLLQDDNKIIVTGTAPYISDTGVTALSVLRFNTDGTIDTTYGVNGQVQILISTDYNSIDGSVLSTNNALFITGETSSYVLNSYTSYCIKLDADGNKVITFGNNGTVVINNGSIDTYTKDIYIASNNQIYLFADTDLLNEYLVNIFKLNSNGSFDNNYSPLLTNTINTLLLYVPDSVITLSSIAEVNDVELSALNSGLGNYDGSSIVIQRNVLANTDDNFNTINGLSFNTGSVILNAITIGTYTNTNGVLTILFNANATTALVNECLQSITYQRTGVVDINGTDWAIAYLFNDGSEASNGALTVQSLVSFRYAYGIPTAIDYCNGYNKMRNVTNGYGSSDTILIEPDSLFCGYVPPPVYPAAGTLLSTYCDGTTKMGDYADGFGAFTSSIIELFSIDCGYIAPSAYSPETGTVVFREEYNGINDTTLFDHIPDLIDGNSLISSSNAVLWNGYARKADYPLPGNTNIWYLIALTSVTYNKRFRFSLTALTTDVANTNHTVFQFSVDAPGTYGDTVSLSGQLSKVINTTNLRARIYIYSPTIQNIFEEIYLPISLVAGTVYDCVLDISATGIIFQINGQTLTWSGDLSELVWSATTNQSAIGITYNQNIVLDRVVISEL